MKVGINGVGRIGRLALRAALGGAHRPGDDPGRVNRLDVVHINEIKGDARTLAHLIEFDSVQGRWRESIDEQDGVIKVGGNPITVSHHAQPQDIAWGDLGVDLVLECSGKFLSPQVIEGHLKAGAKRVIVAAPVKESGVLNIVYGINHEKYEPARDRIITAASCTTNCLAPVVKVIQDNLGIRHGQITTIHDPTNTNLVVDGVHKDLRRARSAMLSLSPTTTGSATAIGLIYPELAGKLNGHAVRAPVLNASLTDAVFELHQSTTAQEVNALFEAAAHGALAGILGYESRPLVSADYAQDTRSSIVDGLSTMVTDGTMLKVYAWYDNEMGYACRMVDLACYVRSLGV